MAKHLSLIALALTVAGLTGCATIVGDTPPLRDIADPESRYADLQEDRPEPGLTGSLYNGRGLSLFEDNKARKAGDLVTVVLVEATQASSRAATSMSKDSALEIAPPTLFGRGVTVGGTNILEAGAEASRSFDGSGNSSQANTLTGQLTARVVRDLGNGNLLISARKSLRLNQANEVIEVQGIVRVADISTDNKVLSSRVADAQIVYGGKGTLARTNAAGWVSKFFMSAIAPI